ncbi:SAM hydrolase/SAM-dependent halogenase family protein [Desulfobulbus oligotrophicus]|jgi:S-adenosylmethionine hydrolase|uniref:SAM-dependent chlorinase/fluorinase n=1 Tax=Desulfobulbus oligotrophicus TaxID=1909699 RepID=A0A7T6AP63_9BACT|nr:SAM-dependent chlorinase/fluorinase [Desulfobulbus oligotrophicus]MDY0391462.1 SAM-dependent chlorinase/fluorinase [Desulfobulbus oligotrophicus]QQG64356.1 SAM-dependent chlorinase/fluorinase [Desulfobulbus oligotrophicus]
MEKALVLITLTTDFGLQDPYVGQLKGALFKGYSAITVVDLTHAIPAWDVAAAARVIRSSYHYFPDGTIHLIVVDPGVGGQRALLVAAGDGHFFVAPDNGVLSMLVADNRIDTIHRVERPDFFRSSVSATFHGRDIMAPVAAVLAASTNLEQFGPAVEPGSIRTILVPESVRKDGCVSGQVQRIDHFGNIQTSIQAGDVVFEPSAFDFLQIGDHRISQFVRTYQDAAPGSLLVLINSSGHVEIAANQASAAERIGCIQGDPVTLHLLEAELPT